MWTSILDTMLRQFFVTGALDLTLPDGQTRRYGPADKAEVQITLRDPALPRRLVLAMELALGEGYMDGTIEIGNDDLDGFFDLITRNAQTGDAPWRRWTIRLRRAKRWFDQHNPAYKARENVAHHYDLSGELYDLFLDDDRQYSCAYFTDTAQSLEAAQSAKVRHIAGKLCLSPGMEVFEIGCGWGGTALALARDHGVKVLGVTLSKEQHRIATERAAAAGLSDRVRFELTDYRSVKGTFDRVVSIGMFEHVGEPHYTEYFTHVHDRLKPDGVALIHTIGRLDRPAATSSWITKYIFPGGYCPALSEVTPTIEKAGLVSTDIEVWRLHYAYTLAQWYDRFTAHRAEAEALYDERFYRMWCYYLKASEYTFRNGQQGVFQLQLARHQQAVPLTRDYLYDGRSGAAREAAE